MVVEVGAGEAMQLGGSLDEAHGMVRGTAEGSLALYENGSGDR